MVELSTDNWLTIVGFVAMATVYVANSRSTAKLVGAKLEAIDTNMKEFKVEIKELSKVVIEQAVQSTRITVMEGRMLAEGARMDAQAGSFLRLQEQIIKIQAQLNGKEN